MKVVVITLLLFVGVCLAAKRGVPLGPCLNSSATHYGDAYLFDSDQGGTCGLDPTKYADLGAGFGAAPAIYNPFDANKADGCGVCYEVYGPGGAQTVILFDHGSETGYFNFLDKDGKGAWNKLGFSGGSAPLVVYRVVSCPDEDGNGKDPWVNGNIRFRWQDRNLPDNTGANNYYFELHFVNHRTGIRNAKLYDSDSHSTGVLLVRKEVQNNFVFQNGGKFTVPFIIELEDFYGLKINSTSFGQAGQTVTQVAYGDGDSRNGHNSGIMYDFGRQFTVPSSNQYANAPDCVFPNYNADATFFDGSSIRAFEGCEDCGDTSDASRMLPYFL